MKNTNQTLTRLKSVSMSAVIGFTVLANHSALADATLTLDADGQASTLQIKDQRVLLSIPQEQTDVLFDSTSQSMQVIDHNQKTVFPINEQTLATIKGQLEGIQGMMSQAMQGLSPEQQAQMQAMMGGFSFGGKKPAPEPQVSMKEIGNASYAGIKCTNYEVSFDGVKEGVACVSSGNSLGISSNDYKTLTAAQDFMFKMGREAGELAKQFGQSLPNFGKFAAEGILISAQNPKEQGSFQLTSINSDSLGKQLTVPQGYKTQDIASQMN